MFRNDSKIFKLIPAIEITDQFKAGYVVEELNSYGKVVSQRFTDMTKPKLMESIKEKEGFKTKGQQLIEDLLDRTEDI